MKIKIELDSPYDGGLTKVERDVSWPEESDTDDVHTMSGDAAIRVDHRVEHLRRVVTQVAALAVDIHHTR